MYYGRLEKVDCVPQEGQEDKVFTNVIRDAPRGAGIIEKLGGSGLMLVRDADTVQDSLVAMGNDRIPKARGHKAVLKSQKQGGRNYGDEQQSVSAARGPHLRDTREVVKGPQSSLQDTWAANRERLGSSEEGPCHSEATVSVVITPDFPQSCSWSFTQVTTHWREYSDLIKIWENFRLITESELTIIPRDPMCHLALLEWGHMRPM